MPTMISFEEALNQVLRRSRALNATERSLSEALGCTLAARVVSREDVPPFDNSAMDGFAVRAKDVTSASPSRPTRLQIIDTVHAGYVSSKTVRPGQCVRIMTGAPMPRGADAVVRMEDTRPVDVHRVDVLARVVPTENRRPSGEDVKKGTTVFEPGRRLSAFDMGLLASMGCTTVRVIRPPHVALLATGDELITPGDRLAPGKLRASTGIVLSGLLTQQQIPHTDYGLVRDSPKDTVEKLRLAFQHDVVLTTGGVSVGDADHVQTALESLGIRIHFWKVRQKPGKPMVFGSSRTSLFFGLPGNPVSSLVCFEMYVRPSLHRLAGNASWSPVRVRAELKSPIRSSPGLRRFLRGRITHTRHGWSVTPLDNQSSGVLSSFAFSNGLIDLDERTGSLQRGDPVNFIVTDLQAVMATLHG